MSNKTKPKAQPPATSEADVREQGGANWDAANAAKVRKTQIVRDEIAELLEPARRAYREAKKFLDSLPLSVPMNVLRSDDHSVKATKDVPVADWNPYDQIVMGLAVIVVTLLLGLGAVNVVTALQSSGNPVFIEQPWMSWMFAGLVPGISLAIKFGYELFDHPQNRKLYAWGIYLSAVLSALIWVVFFALSYEGANAGISWDELGEETLADQLGSSLTIVQIITEILVAAALAIVISNRFASYSASYVMKNPALAGAEKTLEARDAEYQRLLAAFAEADGACVQLDAARSAYISQAVANWRLTRLGTPNA